MNPQVNIQLGREANPSDAEKALSSISGVLRVRQVFPGSPDRELAGMFVLDVDASRIDAALAALKCVPGVDEVEAVQPRTIRPPKRPATRR